jgi:sporulation protein YlmC with PRC-barrel domain
MNKPLTLAVLGTAFVSWAALAQTTTPAPTAPATGAPAATAPAAPPTGAPAATAQRPASADANRPMYELKQGKWRSSKLAGLDVYNNDEKIGDINELIVGQDGKIEAVVIGVGGFLGIGEHNVALPFDQVKFVEEPRRVASADTRPATATAPAGTRPADTTGTTAATPPATTAARTGAADTYRGYPDHAMVNMNKDQLKALPEVRK